VLSPGGYAASAVQDSFCTGACTISILYDQSPEGNHLPVSPPVYWLKNGGTESDAAAAKITIGGHTAYGVKGVAGRGNTYRNDKTTGVATGDQPEEMYMVVDSKFYASGCCYDFGNVETSGNADGKGAIEALYWGGPAGTWGMGGGTGPWVMADLEMGVFGADKKNAASDTSLITPAFATLLMKGPSGNSFGLKGGDAQSGALVTKWDGARPSGWSPMKKQGAIVLGAGGDGSNGGSAIFYEGAITNGTPSGAADDAVQANVVAAGYGR
jgi:hypothetical protein